MIVIADSGSTKTEWCFVENGTISERIISKGINPYFENEDDIISEVKSVFEKIDSESKISAIYFYGAGCTPEKSNAVKYAISNVFGRETSIEVYSDLLGAARALFNKESGIACILGTGSNSCYYNGEIIEKNVSPLGFILGDEGSGAVIGKYFIGSLLKNQFGEDFKRSFLSECNLSNEEIIDRVYKKPFPNRFLASLSPFISKHLSDERVYSLVLNCFKDFFKRNVMQYDYTNLKVAFIGSVAFYYKEILIEVAKEFDITIDKIEASPIDGLIEFHNQ
ncbi:MAG: ATPase [Muribaculaceae bacterium]|nr:ATPase [Muribaculaceae bacterium]